MAAPYHADATDVRSGAPSIASHTPNRHADGTSGDVYSSVVQGHDQRSFLSDLEGVALFGEGVLSIVQNDAPSHRTDIPSGGTPSFATATPILHAEGTTADVANPRREFVRDKQSLQSNIDRVALFDEEINLIIQHDATLPRTDNQTGGGTLSLVSCTPKCHAEGTTADVGRDQRWWQSDIDGVPLSAAAGSILENDALATETDMSLHTHASDTFYSGDRVADPVNAVWIGAAVVWLVGL
eukprot:scaffold86114_cov67-Attheya_sp.AAC.1